MGRARPALENGGADRHRRRGMSARDLTLDLFAQPPAQPRDLERARAQRDQGMARVQEEALANHLAALLLQHVGAELTGEDICLLSGRTAHHPNAWGAAINALVRRGLLIKTGAMRQPSSVASHARAIHVYR